MTTTALAASFAADVRTGLGRVPRRIHPKYFYDALGSRLFEAICALPWYRITRAETALLRRHASEVASFVARPAAVVELGCGTGEKLTILLEAIQTLARVDLIDVSPDALDKSVERARRVTSAPIVTCTASYEDGLAIVAARRDRKVWRASAARRATASGERPRPERGGGAPRAVGNGPPRAVKEVPLLVLFLGSNIGNFDPAEADAFLRQVRRLLMPGDGLLLGADLVKPARELLLAYDDPLGVTAAFNKNLLERINRELGGTFELDGFAHRACWREREARVEMHLVSTRRQTVDIALAGCAVSFEPGDSIWTESSYKYTVEGLAAMGARAGFRVASYWLDEDARFALTLFGVEP